MSFPGIFPMQISLMSFRYAFKVLRKFLKVEIGFYRGIVLFSGMVINCV